MSGWFPGKAAPKPVDDDWDDSFPAMEDHQLECPTTQPLFYPDEYPLREKPNDSSGTIEVA